MQNYQRIVQHQFEDEVTIIPIADVHLGAIEHNANAWDDFLVKVKEEPNTYFVLVGDLIQNGVRNAVGSPFDQTYRPMEQKAIMTRYLEPFAERILCAVSGNHEARTSKESDQDLTYDIMVKLGIEDRYRPDMAFLKVSIGRRKDARIKSNDGTVPCCSYVFCITHGAAGGRLTGNPLNRAEDFFGVIEGADCFVVGHSHKGIVTRPQKIVVDPRNNTVAAQNYLVVSAEAWMNYGGYAARKMLRPAENSHPQRLRLVKAQNNKRIEVLW